jgi:hypothetical protein
MFSKKFKFKNIKWVRKKPRPSQPGAPEQPSASHPLQHDPPKTSHETANPVEEANGVDPISNDLEEEEESPPSAWQTAKNAATLALTLAQTALDGLPIPGAKGAIGGVLLVMSTIDVRSIITFAANDLSTNGNDLLRKAIQMQNHLSVCKSTLLSCANRLFSPSRA